MKLHPTRHFPRKRFGQHFLTDDAVRNRIADALIGDGRIIEIGAGRGALTAQLANAAFNTKHPAPLIAVELDRDLAADLARRYSPQSVEVIQADVLDIELRDLANAENEKFRLVGNLPYNISTALIFHLLSQTAHIENMLFMLQREVAMRLAASPGDKSYGRLSVMAGIAIDCEMLFDVAPQSFDPPPKVYSTVLRLLPKKNPPPIRNRQCFEAVVAAAFTQRRKTLRNALRNVLGNVMGDAINHIGGTHADDIFSHANIDPNLRGEALSIAEFIALADCIADCIDEMRGE